MKKFDLVSFYYLIHSVRSFSIFFIILLYENTVRSIYFFFRSAFIFIRPVFCVSDFYNNKTLKITEPDAIIFITTLFKIHGFQIIPLALKGDIHYYPKQKNES